MEIIDQVVPHEFLFANSIRSGVGRLTQAIRGECYFNQQLGKAKKRKELAAEFLGDKLMPLTDDQLKILIRKYPDLGGFVNIFIEARKGNE